MRVGVHGELHAVPLRAQDVLVTQVEPLGMGVDLQHGARPRAGLEDGVEVGVDARALADPAGRGVADDGDVRVLAGADEAAGEFLPALVEVGVDGGHADVELREELVGPVQGAVRADVEFRAVQQPHPVVRAVQCADLLALGKDLLAGHALHGQVRGVVGDRVVRVAAGGSGGDHVLQRGQPVGEVGVGVQIAADVLVRQEVGKFAAQPGRDLAAVLAQRRRYPGQPERGVYGLLRLGGDALAALGVEEPVLGELEALAHRELPGADVVGLGAGEVLQPRAPGGGRQDP